jgi:signal transduction histidine kinase
MNIEVAQLARLGDALGDGMVLGTTDGQVLSASRRACALLDLPEDAETDQVAERLAHTLYPSSEPAGEPLPSPLLHELPFDEEEVCCLCGQSDPRRLRFSGRVLKPADEPELVVLVLRELPPLPPLSEPPELDPEIRRLQQLRDEILSIASHELKNPLTVIHGAVLSSAPEVRSQPRLSRAADAVRQQSQRMRRLVDQLLDFSRLGLGRLTLQRTPFNLVQQARAVVQHYAEPSLDLRLVAEEEKLTVVGDAMRLERVLASLVAGALRHSEAGQEVVVSLRRVAGVDLSSAAYGRPDPSRAYALVEVRDPGLHEEVASHQHVFARYAPLGEHDSPQAEHWLSLYVGAQVLLLHGGLIWTERQATSGGSVCYALPLT